MRTGRFLVGIVLLSVATPLLAEEPREGVLLPDAGGGQIGKPTPAPPPPEHTGIKDMIRELGTDLRHIPSTENAMWAGIGTGLAFAAHPADPTTNARLSGPSKTAFATANIGTATRRGRAT